MSPPPPPYCCLTFYFLCGWLLLFLLKRDHFQKESLRYLLCPCHFWCSSALVKMPVSIRSPLPPVEGPSSTPLSGPFPSHLHRLVFLRDCQRVSNRRIMDSFLSGLHRCCLACAHLALYEGLLPSHCFSLLAVSTLDAFKTFQWCGVPWFGVFHVSLLGVHWVPWSLSWRFFIRIWTLGALFLLQKVYFCPSSLWGHLCTALEVLAAACLLTLTCTGPLPVLHHLWSVHSIPHLPF